MIKHLKTFFKKKTVGVGLMKSIIPVGFKYLIIAFRLQMID